MSDKLFEAIEQIQGALPWGAVLDAGTGEHSLRWICGIESQRWTAVTSAPARAARLRRHLTGQLRPVDRVISGSWTDPSLLYGERYDTVLADYLLGAIDGSAPYFQDQLFTRLRPHVGRRLYVVGLAPYPEPRGEVGRLVWAIARLRDACILLAGHRCYREYPMDWVIRSLERSGYAVDEALSIPIVYGARFINGQLDVCRRELPHFADPALAEAMSARIEALRSSALALSEREGGLRFGEDYVVAASV